MKTKVLNSSSSRLGVAAGGRAAGQTLIEFIVAVLIFSIIMVGGLTFFTLGANSEVRAKQIDYARWFGNSVIQSCISNNTFDGRWGVGVPHSDAPWPLTVDGTTYTLYTDYTPVIVGSSAKIDVHVIVTWPQNPVGIDFDTSVSSPIMAL